MRRTSDDEVGIKSHGGVQLVVGVCAEPTDQLVVARLWGLIYGGRAAMDVYLETLPAVASLPAVEYGLYIGDGGGHVSVSRAYCVDTMDRNCSDNGRVLFGRKLMF